MKIQTVFEAFEHFELGKDSLEQLHTQIVAGLAKVGQLYTNFDKKTLGQLCKHCDLTGTGTQL